MQGIRNFVKALAQPDTFATFLNYVVKIFLNPIIVLLVPVFLSENYQGYWYTFGSIAALTTFADLGFTSIMTQYVAHEYTYLKLNRMTGYFEGPYENVDRMSSLFRFIVRWLRTVLVAALIIIFVVGLIMFSSKNDGVDWLFPWILYVFASVYNFASQAALSFFEGCDQFATTQKIRTVASLLQCLVTIGLLAVGAGLFALSVPLILKGTIVFLTLGKKFGGSIRQMVRGEIDEDIAWSKEFVPLLGRYAISWVSGYFASQIYNPLTFTLFGSAAAGRVGYSLSIVQAIYTVANVWSLISIPKYNMVVETQEWGKMDRLLRRNIVYSSVIYIIGIIAFYLSALIPITANIIWRRVVTAESMGVLCLAYLGSMVIYAMATYLRAHKKEPFMVVSILSGAISALATCVMAKFWGLDYIFVGLLISEIVVLPLGIWIFMSFRKKWHSSV